VCFVVLISRYDENGKLVEGTKGTILDEITIDKNYHLYAAISRAVERFPHLTIKSITCSICGPKGE
jgi:hypothetical protein